MRGKKTLASLTALAMTAGAALSGGLSTAFAAAGLGGYTWEATSGYQEGTTGVENGDDSVTVSYADVDNNLNVSGFCATMDAADWTPYETLSYTVTNNGTTDISYSIAINTGAKWNWHQSSSATISAGESMKVVYYLDAAEWYYDNELTTISDLYQVQRVNMMVMSPTEDATVTGSITISGWELGVGSGSDPVEPKDGFYVDGTVLRDANQNAFVMRGTNYEYNWFSWDGNTDAGLKEIADNGANCVRIVLADGQKWTANSAGEIENLISICEKYKLVAIFEVHDATGNDDVSALTAAAQYFVDRAGALIGHEDTVIINIANEWMQATNPSAWEAGYITAVKMIRDANLTHCLMIDAGGYGQGASTVLNSGAAVLASDPEKNCMFAVHMYSNAGGSEATVKSTVDGCIARSLCLSIAEFGWKDDWGTVAYEYIMEYCQTTNTGWLAWSWYGDQEFLDMTSANAGGTLYAPWGEAVVNGTYGWKATSKTCSIFSEGPVTGTTTTTTTTESTTTTTTTTTTTIVIPTILPGDVNSDNLVNIADVVRLARYVSQDAELTPAFSADQITAADVNADTYVDASDISALCGALAGL